MHVYKSQDVINLFNEPTNSHRLQPFKKTKKQQLTFT